MPYGTHPYGGVAYAGSDVADIPADTETTLAVEISFTTDPLSTPVWVDITPDVRSWSSQRGRSRELERFQPGRATVVLSNLSAQYDSLNTGGPWFGNLKPMKRIRIRETFSGVTYPIFDGFVDKWQLNYPGKNKDATATVTATDGFKVFARTDLPRSVYADEVSTDAPLIWWRLGEDVARFRDGFALNWGTAGATHDATFVGSPRVGGEVIVVNDPGSSLEVTDNFSSPGTPIQGCELANATFSLLSQSAFSVEAWVRLAEAGTTQRLLWTVSRSADASIHGTCGYFDTTGSGADGRFQFIVVNSAFSLFYGVETPAGSVLPGQIHHVIAVVESTGQMAIWLDGTRYTTAVAGAAATSLSGITRPTNGDFQVGFERDSTPNPDRNWGGEISNFAVWTSQLADARIAAHYAAGTAPWQGDTIKARMDRVLDELGWPALQRELDTGSVTLQSAELGTDALEHLQKAGETEYAGLFFISRDGTVRFADRETVLGREPYPVVYGDAAGQVGYVDFTPDDGDASIRNRAVISRLNGVAKVAQDATSISEFGRFTYTLEGLLSDSEQDSIDYAAFVVDQYKDQSRRVIQLDLSTPITGQESVAYPAMLGPELGDAISVENNPLGGIEFTQVCAIEGIEHSGEPKNALRTTRFILSPEYPIRTLEDEDVATLGYAEVTANQGSITTIVDLTGLSVTVTVGTSRRIRITGYIPQFTRTAGTATFAQLSIFEGATRLQLATAVMNNLYNEAIAIAIETPSAGSHTYKLTANSDGTVSTDIGATNPAFILVEDIGPA